MDKEIVAEEEQAFLAVLEVPDCLSFSFLPTFIIKTFTFESSMLFF